MSQTPEQKAAAELLRALDKRTLNKLLAKAKANYAEEPVEDIDLAQTVRDKMNESLPPA